MSNQQGFSLVEMLLSIGLIAMLAGLSLPLYTGFVARNDLDLTTQSLATALRRAQTYARGVNGDSQWGVAVQSGNAILFKGASYATRDTNYDEATAIATTITPSGLSEVVFSKLNATPSTTGSITLTTNTNDTRTITLNAKGMVSY